MDIHCRFGGCKHSTINEMALPSQSEKCCIIAKHLKHIKTRSRSARGIPHRPKNAQETGSEKASRTCTSELEKHWGGQDGARIPKSAQDTQSRETPRTAECPRNSVRANIPDAHFGVRKTHWGAQGCPKEPKKIKESRSGETPRMHVWRAQSKTFHKRIRRCAGRGCRIQV
jgi:hypothetical protein